MTEPPQNSQEGKVYLEELTRKFVEEKRKVSTTVHNLIENGGLDNVCKQVEMWKRNYQQVERQRQTLEREKKTILQKLRKAETGDHADNPTQSSLQASNNELKEKLEALEKRFTQMDSKNVKLRARNTLLEKEKEELTAKFEGLTIETNNLSIEISKLRGLNAALKNQNLKLKGSISVPEKEKEDLKKQLDTVKGEINNLQTVIGKLKCLNSSLKTQNQELKMKLAAGDSQQTQDERLEEENRIQVQLLEKDIDELKSVIQQLENKNNSLEKDLKDNSIKDVELENEKLRVEIEERDKTLAKMKEELEKFNKIIAENQNLKANLNKTQGTLERVQKDLEKALSRAINCSKLQMENDQLKKQAQDAALTQKLQQQNVELKNQMESLMNDNQTLKRHVHQLCHYQNHLQSAKEHDACNKQTITMLTTENKRLKHEMDVLMSDMVEERKRRLSQADDASIKLTAKINDLETQCDQLRKDLNIALNDTKSKTSELLRVQISEANIKQRLIDMDDALKKARKELNEVRQKERVSVTTLEELKQRDSLFRQRIDTLEEENRNLQKTLEETTQTLDTQSKQLLELNNSYKRMKVEKENLFKQVEAMPKDDVVYLKGVLFKVTSEKENLEKAYQSINEEYLKWKELQNQEDMNLRNTISQLEMENGKLQIQLENLNNGQAVQTQRVLEEEVYRLRKESTTLRHKLKVTQDDYNRLKLEAPKAIEIHNQYRRRLSILEQEKAQLLDELNKSVKEMASIGSTEETMRLRSRIKQLEDVMVSQKQKYDSAFVQSKELMSLAGMLRDKMMELEEENAHLKKNLYLMQSHSRSVLQNISSVDKTTIEQKEKITQLEKEVKLLKAQLEDVLKKYRHAETVLMENKAMRMKLKDMELNVELLRRELNNSLEDLQEQEQQLALLTVENDRLKQGQI